MTGRRGTERRKEPERSEPRLTRELGRVVGVDVHVLGRQIGREEAHCALASAQLYSYVAFGLREVLVGAAFVEGMRNAVATDHLVADEDPDAGWIDGQAAPAYRGQDASPIWIGPGPGGLYERGVSNRARYEQGFFASARLLDEQANNVLDAFAVADNLLRQRLAYCTECVPELITHVSFRYPNTALTVGQK